MKRFLALLGVVLLCGCGNSSRTVEHTETTTTQIGVSKPYTKEKWTSRCVSGGCSVWKKDEKNLVPSVAEQEAEATKGSDQFKPVENEAAAIVVLPPEPTSPVSAEAPVPVTNAPTTTTTTTKVTTPSGTTTTTTTTTRTIRWPRKLD